MWACLLLASLLARFHRMIHISSQCQGLGRSLSLHCPWDIYCLLTDQGSAWQGLAPQAKTGVPSLAGAVAGSRWAAELAPAAFEGMGGEKQLCSAMACPGEGSAILAALQAPARHLLHPDSAPAFTLLPQLHSRNIREGRAHT